MQHNSLTKINAIHLHPNAIALWVENSAYIKEGLKCHYLKLSIVDSPQEKNEDLILSDNFLRQNHIF